jgi:hypothetical protein
MGLEDTASPVDKVDPDSEGAAQVLECKAPITLQKLAVREDTHSTYVEAGVVMWLVKYRGEKTGG